MKKTLMIFMVLAVGWSAFSQVTLTGKVTDESRQPLWGASVMLEGTVIGGITNDKGEFLLHVPRGSFTLRVSYMGYDPVTRILDLQHDDTVVVHLSPKVIMADEVLVSATRARTEVPITYSNLVRKEIAKRNLGQDIPYLIRTLPSVVVTSDAGTGIGYTSFRIRGTDLSRINVTLNGIPMNDAESQGVWWVDLPDVASSTEDIQLQRGVGTSTNGAGAFGASLNLQTFTLEKKPYAEINSSAGSYHTFKNTLRFGTGLLSDRFTFDGRVSKISSAGYIDRASAALNSYAFNAAYYGPRKSILRVIVMTGKEKTYQAWDGVPGTLLDTDRRYNGMGAYTDENGETKYYDNETDNYQQDHLQLFYSKAVSKALRFNTAFYYTHGEGYYEQYKEDQRFSDYLLKDIIIQGDTVTHTDLIRQKWLNNDLYGTVFNVNVKQNRINLDLGGGWNRYLGDHFGKVIWAQYFSNGEKGHQWYDNTGVKNDGNIYAKASIRITEKLFSYLDLQYRGIVYNMQGPDDDLRDITQYHEYHFLNPKAGVKYFFPSGSALYGSIAVAHREPSRYNFKDAPPGGPAPTPEKLTDVEIGASSQAGMATLEANLYYMKYRDQLVYTGKINDVGVAIMTNVPESYRLGVELVSGIQFFHNLSWKSSLTLSNNRILHFTQYIDDWDTGAQRVSSMESTHISFSPAITAKSILDLNLFSLLDVRWISDFVGRQYIDNSSDQERSLDPYWVNDLSFSLDINTAYTRHLHLYFTINNLFNCLYESNAWVYPYYEGNELKLMTGYFPQAERNFLVGLSLGF